jgi:integrase
MELGEFRCVKKMLSHLKLLTRSSHTENAYLKGLKYFVKAFGVEDLDTFIEQAREGKIDANKVYEEWVLKLSSSGVAPKTVGVWSSALRKLFESNDVELKKRIRIKSFNVNESTLPSREELKKMLNSCDLRTRTIMLILLSSGLRVGELLRLRVGDVDFSSSPAKIRVRGSEAKERKGRITFISEEARESLEAYLDKRREMGHEVGPGSPLIATDAGREMSLGNLEFILRSVFKNFSRKDKKLYMLHPHVLRKWFKTQVISSGVPGPIADRLCGHSRYLAEEYELYTEDQLRNWYVKAMPSLTILSKTTDEERMRREIALEAIRKFAEAFGIDPARIRIERERKIGRSLSEEEEIQLLQNEIRKLREGEGDEQRIVREDELEKYLKRGWQFVSVLPSQRILIRKS